MARCANCGKILREDEVEYSLSITPKALCLECKLKLEVLKARKEALEAKALYYRK